MRSNRAFLTILTLLLTGGAAAALYWTFVVANEGPQPPRQTAELSDPEPVASMQSPGPTAPPAIAQPQDTKPQPRTPDSAPEAPDAPVIKAVDAPELAESLRFRGMPEIENRLNGRMEFSATIHGRVTDSTGNGVEGATVQAGGISGARANVGALGRAGAPRFATTATTDASGNYEIVLKASLRSNTEAVQVQLSATAAGCVPGEPLILDAVRNGEERRGADLSMKLAALVRGKVFDATGTPLAGITILATRQAENPRQPRRRDMPAGRNAVQTDENGEWKMDTLAPGEWQFMATGPEHDLPVEQRFTLALAEGIESVAPDMTMQRTTAIRARLMHQDGSPISGDSLRATAVLKLSTGQVATSTGLVDEAGYVVFARVPPESQELTVRVNGYEPSSPVAVSPLPHSESDAGTIYLTPIATSAQEE